MERSTWQTGRFRDPTPWNRTGQEALSRARTRDSRGDLDHGIQISQTEIFSISHGYTYTNVGCSVPSSDARCVFANNSVTIVHISAPRLS